MSINDYLIKRDDFSAPAYEVLSKGYLDKQDFYVYLAGGDAQVLTLTPREIQVVTYVEGDYLNDEQSLGNRVINTVKACDALVIDTLTMQIRTDTFSVNTVLCVEH